MNEAIIVTGMCQVIVFRSSRYASPSRIAILLTSPMQPGIRPRKRSIIDGGITAFAVARETASADWEKIAIGVALDTPSNGVT